MLIVDGWVRDTDHPKNGYYDFSLEMNFVDMVNAAIWLGRTCAHSRNTRRIYMNSMFKLIHQIFRCSRSRSNTIFVSAQTHSNCLKTDVAADEADFTLDFLFEWWIFSFFYARFFYW